MSSEIRRLDKNSQSKLRSTQILTSLPQIISELVQNALDASATHIDIGVDQSEWACWVRDNGTGIRKDGLAIIAEGCESGRYASSKAYNPTSLDEVKTFGFRGEALASAADLSCMEISSRTVHAKESWSLIMKGGSKLYYGPSTRWRRERPGTTVYIRDAFYNLPIRRLSHASTSRTMEIVRREIEITAIAFPSVSFTLEDTEKECKDGYGKGRILTISKTSSTLATFRQLFGKTLTEQVDDINVKFESMSLEGFVSLVGVHSKAYQFLYINNHILNPCEIHRLIEQIFNASSFAKHACDGLEEAKLNRPASQRSPRKGDRKPVYILKLTVPPNQVDNCLDPAKAMVNLKHQQVVTKFILDVVESFLVRHCFRSSRPNRPEDFEEIRGPSISCNARQTEYKQANSIPNNALTEIETPNLRTRRFITAKDIYIQRDAGGSPKETTWVDPSTGWTYIVDPRTGNSYIKRGHEQKNDGHVGTGSKRTTGRMIVDTQCLKRGIEGSGAESETKEVPSWIRGALRGNDAFATMEAQVVSIPMRINGPEDGQEIAQKKLHAKPWFKEFKKMVEISGFQHVDDGSPHALNREDISYLKVIAQVDHKFLLCSLRSEGTVSRKKQLFIVDQHAADERIRVEHFLKKICLEFCDKSGQGVSKRHLEPPRPVVLTRAEKSSLLRSNSIRKAFEAWGFTLFDEVSSEALESESGTVHLNGVPEVVADKLLSGEDLTELVKDYLASFEPSGANETPLERFFGSLDEIDEFCWTKALRFCPRGLVELIKTKACRGAIMFNDVLTQGQCERLIQELSLTAFPLQCAHGRPSIVPMSMPRVGLSKSVYGDPPEERWRRRVDWRSFDVEQQI